MSERDVTVSRRTLIAAGLATNLLAALPGVSPGKSAIRETTIRVDGAVTTLVNLVMVSADRQAEVSKMLRYVTETAFVKMSGWISTSILTGRSGTEIVLYSQWRDEAAIEAFRQDPALKAYFQKIASMAKVESYTCDVSVGWHI
jgi:quinol monooxygenase YgiN